jgi:hypothetical protein
MISIPVAEGQFERFVYTPEIGTLRGYRRDGRVTVCEDVAEALVLRLRDVECPGRFFTAEIASRHQCWSGILRPRPAIAGG